MWPLRIKFETCFHINTRWLVDGIFFFFWAQIREKSNGNDSQGCCGSGECTDGPGKLKHVSKIRNKKKKLCPQTGRHVNVAQAPLDESIMEPSHAAFSHQKSHQCIKKRYSLGSDKLILSSSPPDFSGIIIHLPPAGRTPSQKNGNYLF